MLFNGSSNTLSDTYTQWYKVKSVLRIRPIHMYIYPYLDWKVRFQQQRFCSGSWWQNFSQQHPALSCVWNDARVIRWGEVNKPWADTVLCHKRNKIRINQSNPAEGCVQQNSPTHKRSAWSIHSGRRVHCCLRIPRAVRVQIKSSSEKKNKNSPINNSNVSI